MPCEWAIPHMIAGVTAAPRWQWSSASGIDRDRWRTINAEDTRRDRALASHPSRSTGQPPVDAGRVDAGACAHQILRWLMTHRSGCDISARTWSPAGGASHAEESAGGLAQELAPRAGWLAET